MCYKWLLLITVAIVTTVNVYLLSDDYCILYGFLMYEVYYSKKYWVLISGLLSYMASPGYCPREVMVKKFL